MKSLFDMWTAGEISNFGSFQTAILKAYQLADIGNQEILKVAFPKWFVADELYEISYSYGGSFAGETKSSRFIEATCKDEALSKFNELYRSEIIHSVTKVSDGYSDGSVSYQFAKNFVHDASGIENPEAVRWTKKNGIYYPAS